jgi:hypothetical protein
MGGLLGSQATNHQWLNCRLAQLCFKALMEGITHIEKLDKFNVNKIKPNVGN